MGMWPLILLSYDTIALSRIDVHCNTYVERSLTDIRVRRIQLDQHANRYVLAENIDMDIGKSWFEQIQARSLKETSRGNRVEKTAASRPRSLRSPVRPVGKGSPTPFVYRPSATD